MPAYSEYRHEAGLSKGEAAFSHRGPAQRLPNVQEASDGYRERHAGPAQKRGRNICNAQYFLIPYQDRF